MRKHLKESLGSDYDSLKQEVVDGFKECLRLYEDDEEYKELGIMLGVLRALGIIHQSHHWQTLGSTFYGDHLLFERLYGAVQEEVDMLAEKAVGVGSPALTNYFRQLRHFYAFFKCVSGGEAPVKESLKAEKLFLILGELVMQKLEGEGKLTRGVEQALGNILDKHESHVYLLKQRDAS